MIQSNGLKAMVINLINNLQKELPSTYSITGSTVGNVNVQTGRFTFLTLVCVIFVKKRCNLHSVLDAN